MLNNNKTYHIVGAGIAGLSAAKKIKDKNPNNKVVVYEASNHLGGRCYSYYNPKLEREIDNGTHVVVGANKLAKEFINKDFEKDTYFFDLKNKSLNSKFWKYLSHLKLSIFNTSAKEVPNKMWYNVISKIAPFVYNKRKVYYSKNDLTNIFINQLSKNSDVINFGYSLQNLEINSDKVCKLIFNKETIDVSNDTVVLAVDPHNYCKIFNEEDFDYNQIINVFYRTSQKIHLPQGASYMALINGISHWVFVNNDIVAVTISNANDVEENDELLAQKVWLELAQLRGVNTAFVPPYQVMRHKRATIRQDDKNNQKRSSIRSYKNMLVVGDWTIKDEPCCIETAIKSAMAV